LETQILLWKHVKWEHRQFGDPDSTMEACRVGTIPIRKLRFYYGNQHSIMRACRVGTTPIWKPTFYYRNQHPIMETNIHIKWKQHHFGNPDSTMETNILL
jgi:hypothetical protein